MMMSSVDRWLVRAASVAAVVLALYFVVGTLVDFVIWRRDVTTVIRERVLTPPSSTPATK